MQKQDETQKEEKKSVVDQVMDGIISDIIEEKLRPGERIPTEMELCAKYGAGRNSVREAVKMLEANGVLYIKRADGTFVSENYSHKMLDPMLYSIILQQHSWKDFVQMRAVIDIGTLSVIIRNAQPGDSYKDLKKILVHMEAELYEDEPSVDRIMEYDTQFHDAIAARAENPQIVTITDYITRLTTPSRKKTLIFILENQKESGFIELHRQMIHVLEHRETDKIVQTVMDHYVYWNQY